MMKNPEEIKKSKKRQNIISVLILVFGTVLAYIFLGPKSQDFLQNSEKETETAATVNAMVVSKENMNVAKIEKSVSLQASGINADVVSEFSGRIKELNFEIGDKVYEGQTLAIFDQSEKENSLKVSYESAKKSYELTKDNLEKTEDVAKESIDLAERAIKISELQKDQASTDEEKDIAQQNLKIAKDQKEQAESSSEIQINGAKIQLEQAKLGLDQARIAYEKTVIKAPISGMINSKKINKEDYINPGQVIASIVGEGKAEATVFLNLAEIERIKSGDEAQIEINGKSYPSKIEAFSKIANSDNGRFQVKIKTKDNISGNSNQTAKIILNVYLNGSHPGAFFIPLDAVNIGQNKTEAFVIEGGLAKAKKILIGEIIGTQIEVLEGLSEGDRLIIENSRNLQDGQKVKANIL